MKPFHNLRENQNSNSNSNSNNGIFTESKKQPESVLSKLFRGVKNKVMSKSRYQPKYIPEGNRVGVSASNELALKRGRPRNKRSVRFTSSNVKHQNGSITSESVNNQKNSGIYHRNSLPTTRTRGRSRIRSDHNENTVLRNNILNRRRSKSNSNSNSNEGVGHVRRGRKGREPQLHQEIVVPPSLENLATARQIANILNMVRPTKMNVKGG